MKTAFVARRTAAGVQGKKERVEDGERVTVASSRHSENPRPKAIRLKGAFDT